MRVWLGFVLCTVLIHTVLVRQSLEGLCIVMRVPVQLNFDPFLVIRRAVEMLEIKMVTLNLRSAETHNVSSSFVRELERNQKKKKKKKK